MESVAFSPFSLSDALLVLVLYLACVGTVPCLCPASDTRIACVDNGISSVISFHRIHLILYF